MGERGPVVSNHKISFRAGKNLKTSVHKLDSDMVKLHHNYAIIRRKYVYSINFSGYINITKLRTCGDIPAAIEEICCLLQLPNKQPAYNIDNITASGHFGHTISLHKLQKYFAVHRGPQVIRFNFRPDYFCGANIKFAYGTIIIFHTGSFTIVGSKSKEDIQRLFSETKKILAEIKNV